MAEQLDGRRIRVLKVTDELLRIALKLPPDCHITGLSHDLYFHEGSWALRVESPNFSVVPFGGYAPLVMANYRMTDGKPEFAGWTGEGIAESADEPITTKG